MEIIRQIDEIRLEIYEEKLSKHCDMLQYHAARSSQEKEWGREEDEEVGR